MASTDLSKFNLITVSEHSDSLWCMLKKTLSNRLIHLTLPTPDVTPYSSKRKLLLIVDSSLRLSTFFNIIVSVTRRINTYWTTIGSYSTFIYLRSCWIEISKTHENSYDGCKTNTVVSGLAAIRLNASQPVVTAFKQRLPRGVDVFVDRDFVLRSS